MKINFFFIILLRLLFIVACNNDEQSDNNVDIFQTTCCQVPPLQTCIDGASLYVPNVFTPNADGTNDVFRSFSSPAISKINSFIIFQNDGSVIMERLDFQPNDYSFGWDGQLTNGQDAPDGVYNYSITATNIAAVTMSFEGKVCCRRTSNPMPCVEFEKHCAYGRQHDGGTFDYTLPTGEENTEFDCE